MDQEQSTSTSSCRSGIITHIDCAATQTCTVHLPAHRVRHITRITMQQAQQFQPGHSHSTRHAGSWQCCNITPQNSRLSLYLGNAAGPAHAVALLQLPYC